ncbi:metallophosphoesterase [Myxococcota bacterium]|nr:metallophosphoesterase [Myxococcota bacterium]
MRASWVALPFVLVLSAAPRAAEAQGVFRGPYLNDVTSDAISVLWESPAPTTGTLRYGAPGALVQSAVSGPASTHQEIRITGLSAIVPAGGEIQYELDVDGTTYGGRFKTAPSGRTPFSFIVYGDNRSSPEQHQVVVEALLQEMPTVSFAINSGDLVSSGQRESDWDAFFPVAAPFLASTPLFVAIGNHEVALNRWDVTERIFRMPTDVPPASNSESHYKVVYGNVELIVLNVEVDSLYTIGLLAGDQEDWLEQVLASRTIGVDHRFLFIHQGPYSSKLGRNGNFWLRQWLEQLAAADIDVIFSGHDHYAERGFTENGLYYVIHGGGGAPLYETLGPRVTDDHTIMFGESRLGYARVDIDGPKATVTIKGIGGETVDQFSYGDAQSPACTQASDCGAVPINGCPGGAWDCVDHACRFACPAGAGSLIACLTDGACEDSIGAQCPGTATCEHPSVNPLAWYCTCNLPPDCATDTDCANRASPIPGCTGTWACVTEVCEFTTVMCLPVDGGVVEDGGTSDGGIEDGAIVDAGSEDATVADASAVDAAAPTPDAGLGATTDAALGDGGPLAPGDESGCGCTAARSAPSEGALLFAALALLLVHRRDLRARQHRRVDPDVVERGR